MALDGDWFNELGSRMSIRCKDGRIFGTYETAVGNAAGKYEMNGSYDREVEDDISLGFAVAWTNDQKSTPAVTSWCGQYQSDLDGHEAMVTMWLLTRSTEPGDDWESTLVGSDVFTRSRPSNEIQEVRIKARPASHPGVKRTAG